MGENNLDRSTITLFYVMDSRQKQLPGATLMAIILILKFRLKFEWKYRPYYHGSQYKKSIWLITCVDRLNEHACLFIP
jgi:hypothetical protein